MRDYSESFKPPIPEGHKIHFGRIDVAGAQHRGGHPFAFARLKAKALHMQREPRNPHDPNAIRVIGLGRGMLFRKRLHIGYIPRDIASQIAKAGNFPDLLPRLRYISIKGRYVDIVMDITGPKPEKKSR